MSLTVHSGQCISNHHFAETKSRKLWLTFSTECLYCGDLTFLQAWHPVFAELHSCTSNHMKIWTSDWSEWTHTCIYQGLNESEFTRIKLSWNCNIYHKSVMVQWWIYSYIWMLRKSLGESIPWFLLNLRSSVLKKELFSMGVVGGGGWWPQSEADPFWVQASTPHLPHPTLHFEKSNYASAIQDHLILRKSMLIWYIRCQLPPVCLQEKYSKRNSLLKERLVQTAGLDWLNLEFSLHFTTNW